MSLSLDSVTETPSSILDESDPVIITTLLVELIDAHRQGTITDATYEKGFALLNEHLQATASDSGQELDSSVAA